jgi:hypothetical protein
MESSCWTEGDDKFVEPFTSLLSTGYSEHSLATNLSSRLKESWVIGPPKGMKNAFCSVTTLHASVALPFVIPSEAEGSAVPRTFPGNAEPRPAGKLSSRPERSAVERSAVLLFPSDDLTAGFASWHQ